MAGRQRRSVQASPVRRSSRSLTTLSAVVVTLSLLAVSRPTHALTGDSTGHWTQNTWYWNHGDPNVYAIHMMLLRGDDSPYHSRILFGSFDNGSTFLGGEWGWSKSNDGCNLTLPGIHFDSLFVPSSGNTYDPFCGGFVPLGTGGALFAGGADRTTDEYGNNQARILQSATGTASPSWQADTTRPGRMADWRWYPSATVLGDGRVMVTSGNGYAHHRFFGGRRDGTVPGALVRDSVYRFGPSNTGHWDSGVRPDTVSSAGRPVWREDHTAVQMETAANIHAHVVFGGKDASGLVRNDTWFLKRDDVIQGSDYGYHWEQGPTTNLPPARSRHSAMAMPGDLGMYIYGGRDNSGSAIAGSDVYRMDGAGGAHWTHMTPSGTGPSARLGHTAIYDEKDSTQVIGGVTYTKVERMIVFGGVASDTSAATDTSVYELRFDPTNYSNATWYRKAWANADTSGQVRRPAARWGHAMAWDGVRRYNRFAGRYGHVGFMYGGQLGASAYSDTLWLLWLFEDGTAGWQPKLIGGAAPGARARHTLILDAREGLAPSGVSGVRLYVFGGENTALADSSMHVLDPWDSTCTWQRWASPGFKLSGQSATLDNALIQVRTPEVYVPSTGYWQSPRLTASPLAEPDFPPTFVISGGTVTGNRVLAMALNDSSYYLDVVTSGSSSAWSRLANASIGFQPLSGVLYRPNKVMVSGGIGGLDTSLVVGYTKTLDAGNLSNSWMASQLAVPRTYANLVLTPDGKVAAIGGNGSNSQANDLPVRRPQIWDPNAGSNGTWRDTSTLEREPTDHAYHSTAVLLPDGRILSSGGESEHNAVSDMYKANLFCPPYLYKLSSDSLATRPVISSAADTMAWTVGPTYTIVTSDTTGIRGACLMRSGAATHAFDQNQRYVPLNLWIESKPTRLLVSGPTDASLAPPGDYLLFILGSADRKDVPSIARWMKVGGSGLDKPDVTRPAAAADFSAVCDPNTPNGWIVSWTATADDSVLTESGPVSADNVRKSSSHITETTWSSNSSVYNSSGATPGTIRSISMGASGTLTTWVRMKSVDNNNLYSALSPELGIFAWTSQGVDCSGGGGMYAGGGGGGGLAVKRAPGSASLAPSGTASALEGGFSENSVLNGVSTGSRGHDLYKLPEGIGSGGTAAVRLRETFGRAVALDAARLLTVDHSSDVSAYSLDESIVTGTRRSAAKVVAADGTDITTVVNGSGCYSITPNDVLTITLGTGGGSSPILVNAGGSGALQLQVPDGQSSWRTASQGTPRVEPDEMLFAAPGSDSIRIVTRGYASLGYIGSLAVSSALPTAQTANLLSAQGRRLGDVTSAVVASDSLSATLVGPDTLVLSYSLPQVGNGVRDYFFAVDATPLDPQTLLPAALRPSESELPARFALEQNRPNPFSTKTTIRYALPMATPVRLEVFDAMGRHVRTLALGSFVPGYHSVEWDHRNATGTLVHPGVYLCRLIAGSFRDQKKMVLLP